MKGGETREMGDSGLGWVYKKRGKWGVGRKGERVRNDCNILRLAAPQWGSPARAPSQLQLLRAAI